SCVYRGLGDKETRDTTTHPDANLDIGATVTVDAWHDGRARVQYRGADWDVELASGKRGDARVYQVSAVRGNCLVVIAKPAG
ncbi:NfeD family protein, partial [Burkholderia thailandensis]|uniref:NfeD family protein n=1 Tax=Burkholderia thailandensis TaxID=57975 RepID=UPI00217F21DB|nr:NfeD family protein [Burkholderia thailandensis]